MNRLVTAAGLTGFLVVGLGAFGAHGLRGILDAGAMAWWQTATLYGLVHAVLAAAAGWSGRSGMGRAGFFALLGVWLFSGSLYVMALSGVRALGMVTPFGGVAFLLAWGLIGWSGLHANRDRSAGRDQ